MLLVPSTSCFFICIGTMKKAAVALLALLAISAAFVPSRYAGEGLPGIITLQYMSLINWYYLRRAQADGDVSDEEEFEDIQERAFLIVRRVVSDARPIEAKTSTVTVEVYNAGTT